MFITAFAFSQIQTNGAISVRIGDGYNYTNNDTTDYDYFESIGDLNFYRGNFRGWLQYEWSTEPEIGLPMDKIRKRALIYENEFLTAELGDFYPLIGRGLVMNAFDNQGQDWDSGLDGFHLNLSENQHNIGILSGEMEFYLFSPDGDSEESRTPSKTETYLINGTYFSTSIANFDFGLHHLITNVDTMVTIYSYKTEKEWAENRLSGGFASTDFGHFDLFSEIAIRNTNLFKNINGTLEKTIHKGFGIYSTISGYFDLFSVLFEYKNYQFDVVNQDDKLHYGRLNRIYPFQNPPTCAKELGSQLLSRISHPTNFNDEVGGQIEITTMFPNDWMLIVSGAVASRTTSWEETQDGLLSNWSKKHVLYFPKVEDEFFPSFELISDVSGYLNDMQLTGIVAYSQKTIGNYLSKEKESFITAPFTITFPLSFGSVYSSFEYQFAEKKGNDGNVFAKFSNDVTNFSVSIQPNFSFGVSGERTDETIEDGEKKWLQFEASMRIRDSYLLQIMYGSERGGIKCTNGICRKYPPFNGLRIAFSGQF